MIGREPELTKNDRLVSGAYPAMIGVANLHSIRLTTPQNTQVRSIERGGVKISLPHHRQFLRAEAGSAVFYTLKTRDGKSGI